MLGVTVTFRALSSLIMLMVLSQNFCISNKKVMKFLNSLKDDMDDVKMRITSIENKLNSCELEGTNNVTESNENENSEMAFLVTGGSPNPKSVEVILGNGTSLCLLDDLPDSRYAHKMDGHLLCGGEYTPTSCLHYDKGSWKGFEWQLNYERYYFISWRRPENSTIVMSGYGSSPNNEKVTINGSVESFQLKYDAREACSIQFKDHVIVTGGYYNPNRVSIYNDDGWVENMPSLNSGRRAHGCGHYYNIAEQLVHIVTGGNDGGAMKSTEKLVLGETSWSFVGNLPSERFGLEGFSMSNDLFMAGGYTGDGDEILKFDKENENWIKIGNMKKHRNYFAITILPLKELQPFCNL